MDGLCRMNRRETRAACPAADVNCDGLVDFADLNAVLAAWGPCEGCPEDMNYDGEVGFNEILAILAAWGPCE